MSNQTMQPLQGAGVPESEFSGGAFGNYFRNLAAWIVTILTLGLAYPWMQSWLMRWKVEHTTINGRRLEFTGRGGELFGKYIVWLLLSIITLGIYFIVRMSLNLVQWEKQHTRLVGDNSGGESDFDGTWLQMFGVNLVCILVSIVTLTFGMYWAFCYRQRWFAKHTLINGKKVQFTGTGMQFFGKCIGWVLLTIITIGIYSFWLVVKIRKWETKHTVFADVSDAAGPNAPYAGNAQGNAQGANVGGQTAGEVQNVNGQPAQKSASNSLAIAGFVLSLFPGMVIIGFILSIVGLVQSKQYGGNGKGLAIAGIVIGALWIVGVLVYYLVVFIIPLVTTGHVTAFGALMSL